MRSADHGRVTRDTCSFVGDGQIVTSREILDGIFLWDDLAAVAAIRRATITIEHRMVAIDDTGAIRDDPAFCDDKSGG